MIAISNAENFHLATFYIKSLFGEISDGFRFEALDVVVTESDKASFASFLNSLQALIQKRIFMEIKKPSCNSFYDYTPHVPSK